MVTFASISFAGYIGTGGVRKVETADHSGDTQWYKITCNDGKYYKIGKLDGGKHEWWGSYGAIGEFRGLSLDEAAQKGCQ